MSSSETKFSVARGDETLGAMSLDEIATALSAQKLSITDFAYDESQSDWVPLFEFAPLKSHLSAKKPKAPPKKVAAPVVPEEEVVPYVDENLTTTSRIIKGDQWFVRKGMHKYGPYDFAGVVKSLQEKRIYEFDLVQKDGKGEWVRIAEHPDFHADKIRDLQAKSTDVEGPFVRRQFARRPFETEVLIHDNNSLWMGRSFEGSLAGSGLVIENSLLLPGQTVHVQFSSALGVPAFNAVAEIVSKKFASDVREAKSPVIYGIRFVQVQPEAINHKLKDYFSKRPKAG